MQRLFAIGAGLGPAVTESLASQRLTPARIGLVQELHRSGPMSHRQLSRALGCTPRNVTGLVDATASLGLVERRPHPTDRRAQLVSLTEAGEQSVAEWQRTASEVAARLFADLSDADVAQLWATLGTVLSRLNGRPTGTA